MTSMRKQTVVNRPASTPRISVQSEGALAVPADPRLTTMNTEMAIVKKVRIAARGLWVSQSVIGRVIGWISHLERALPGRW